MRKILVILSIILMAAALSGCTKKVVTVADMFEAGQEELMYIKIKELELRDQDSAEKADAHYCVVMIPAGYVESEEIPGMYVHERSPLDSSNVYYTASPNVDDRIDYAALTADIYEKSVEDAYKQAGKESPDIRLNSFEQQDIEGFPAYVIRSSFAAGGSRVEQLTYLIIADKLYTITYSQAADDELLADFEVSEGRIKLVRQ